MALSAKLLARGERRPASQPQLHVTGSCSSVSSGALFSKQLVINEDSQAEPLLQVDGNSVSSVTVRRSQSRFSVFAGSVFGGEKTMSNSCALACFVLVLLFLLLLSGSALFGVSPASWAEAVSIAMDMESPVTDIVELDPQSAGSAAQYTHVQYLGLNLFTVPGTQADGCLSEESDELESCYLGSQVVQDDLNRRAEIMGEAIENVFASNHWDRSPHTLKVFLAPEFFWRGAHGAYRLYSDNTKDLANTSSSIVGNAIRKLGDERFKHWLFVLGTIIAAKSVELGPEQLSHLQQVPRFEKYSYYNFAPIHVGGTQDMYMHFKHFISGIDFLQTSPELARSQPVQPPPGRSGVFCKRHPDARGCVYGKPAHKLLKRFGFGSHKVLENGIFEVSGLKIGLEICLDHAVGELCKVLGSRSTVDLQLIVSAGMNIASGPVCTMQGGPVLLSDGFSRTELSLNQYGRGRESAVAADGKRKQYNVGMVYGADAMVGLQQWIGDTLSGMTGTGFGSRNPGQATLPGGSPWVGETGVKFVQVSALGDDWQRQLEGFYNYANYVEAKHIDETVAKALRNLEERKQKYLKGGFAINPQLNPTVDIYGPLPVGLSLLK